MTDVLRGLKDPFAAFLADPSRDTFREVMKGHVGESRDLDFKADWPKAGALAKHILAMANSGGGCLIVGVTENDDGTVDATGLSTLTDKADITNGLKTRLPSSLLGKVSVSDFVYDTSDYAALVGKKFQVLIVAPDTVHVPFVAERDGEGLRAGAIYVRREGVSEEANYGEVQRLINGRIASGHSTAAEMEVKEHLDQLEALYERIPRKITALSGGLLTSFPDLASMFLGKPSPNPSYPAEDFQAFVLRMIEAKKVRIERELGVSDR